MSWRLWERLDMPLLRRELIEASRRRRLWIVRCLLAAIQGLFVLLHYSDFNEFDGPVAAAGVLGRGRELASMLNVLCLVILYLLLPITACAAFANERERQTLPLLLISRISPARLVAEKFLSSLVLVVIIMLLNLPLVTLAYALGGLSPVQLLLKATVLLVAAVQVNSAAIFWSAVFSTSLRAFWATIITLFAFLIGPTLFGIARFGRTTGTVFGVDVAELFIAFWQLSEFTVPLSDALPLVIAPLLCGSLFLISAVLVLTRWRWEAPLTGRIRVPQSLREFFQRRFTRSGARGRSAAATPVRVPESQPIAWREHQASGGLQVWGYPGAAACMPFAFMLMCSPKIGFSTWDTFVFLDLLLLIGGALIVLGAGARVIGSERERETLSVLLTIPLTTREIVWQKLAGVRRHRNLMLIPFGVLAVHAAILRFPSVASMLYLPGRSPQDRRLLPFPFAAEMYTLTLVWEHLAFVMWIAVCWSLASRTTLRAAIGTLATVLGYCLLHFVSLFLVMETLRGDGASLLTLLPIIALITVKIDDAPSMEDVALTEACLLISPIFLGICIWCLRTYALWSAPQWLERETGEDGGEHES